jgi:indole-3-glycerol phosphate synthase
MILDDIVAHKKTEVLAARERVALADLEKAAARMLPARGFGRALVRHDRALAPNVIAEIKKASPSKGVFREDFRPVDFARSYRDHGAAAISVLTDEKFFQGGLDVLRSVRMAVDLPLLRKEFIIDPYQIVEARAAGADAILLIVAILTDAQLGEFRRIAEEWGLDCLVEVHTADEGRRAADAGAKIIGVNNRNLTTFKTDVRHTEAILPALPKGAIVVSESGIATSDDVRYLASLDIDAILVGETLMRQEDPGEGIALLLGRK